MQIVSQEHRTPDLLLQWHLGSLIIFGINLFNDVFVVVSVRLKNTNCSGMLVFLFVKPCSCGRSVCSYSQPWIPVALLTVQVG